MNLTSITCLEVFIVVHFSNKCVYVEDVESTHCGELIKLDSHVFWICLVKQFTVKSNIQNRMMIKCDRKRFSSRTDYFD